MTSSHSPGPHANHSPPKMRQSRYAESECAFESSATGTDFSPSPPRWMRFARKTSTRERAGGEGSRHKLKPHQNPHLRESALSGSLSPPEERHGVSLPSVPPSRRNPQRPAPMTSQAPVPDASPHWGQHTLRLVMNRLQRNRIGQCQSWDAPATRFQCSATAPATPAAYSCGSAIRYTMMSIESLKRHVNRVAVF